MTRLKLSLAAVMALGVATSAMAADDVASAFKEGKLDGRIRLHYFYTNWDDNDQWDNKYSSATPTVVTKNGDKSDRDSKGLAIGGSLIYKTAPLYGTSVGVGFYTTQNAGLTEDGANSVGSRITSGSYKNTTASDLFARGPGATTDYASGYSVLAQSYVQYNIGKTDIRLGRLLMTNPFISPNDTKMIPIAIQGASAHVAEIGDTLITFDYANKIKERGMTYFGNMADTGDAPDAIKNYYHTHYTATTTDGLAASTIANYGSGGEAPSVYIAGIKNKSIKDLELQAWVMNWPDIVRQYMLEANYGIKVGDTGLSFGARYMSQIDEGAGDIIRPMDGAGLYNDLGVTNSKPTGSKASDIDKKGDNNNKIDTHLLAIRAMATHDKARLLLAYAQTSKDGDLLAPWRGFPTEGYTRSMTQTDWIANTKSYKVQIDYDFSNIAKGLSALVSYAYYDKDPSKVPYQGLTDRYYGNGDCRQVNIDVKYAVPSIKGLDWKLRLMAQKNDVVPTTKLLGTANSYATASEGFGNNTSNREMRIEMNYNF